MEKKLFSIPKPSRCGTFISFNYWNTEKFCYKRFKKHLSRKIPAEKRRAALAEMVEFWTAELKNGYNPFAEQKKEQQSTEMYRVGNVTQAICKERIKNLRSKQESLITGIIFISSVPMACQVLFRTVKMFLTEGTRKLPTVLVTIAVKVLIAKGF